MSKIFSIFASDLRKRQFESELPLTLLLLYSYLPLACHQQLRSAVVVLLLTIGVVNIWGDVSKWFIFLNFSTADERLLIVGPLSVHYRSIVGKSVLIYRSFTCHLIVI